MQFQFSVTNFRNLSPQTVSFEHDINLILGPNGSGKTSLLEAIYTLYNGKSFRTNKTRNMVSTHGESEDFILRSMMRGHKHREVETNLSVVTERDKQIALRKSVSEKYLAKVDGEVVEGIAELARLIPTQIVEPRSFNLLEGGASARRKLLDWAVFHVEHSFIDVWKRFNAVYKQRSALLKQGAVDESLLSIWDAQLVQLSREIDTIRRPIVQRITDQFYIELKRLLPELVSGNTNITYYPGWDDKKELEEVFAAARDRDIQRKRTHFGAHKADLRFSYKGLPVVEGLSRGQQKLVVLALHIAQFRVIVREKARTCLLLLDDASAELDDVSLRLLLQTLDSMPIVCIATALDKALITRVLSSLDLTHKAGMFHVEHGKIQSVNNEL